MAFVIYPPSDFIEQIARLQVLDQRPDTECPFRTFVGPIDPVDETPELRRGNFHAVSDFVGEALSRATTILYGREHGAEKQYSAVWILMIAVHHLRCKIFRVAADRFHRAFAGHFETVCAMNCQRQLELAQYVHGELAVEQSNKRPDSAGSIIVFSLAE